MADIGNRVLSASPLLVPLVVEAMHHPALGEKILSATSALPAGATVAHKEEAIVNAVVSWLQSRRVGGT